MTTHVYEYKGFHFRVEYTRDADGVPTFESVFLLGADYQPVGPNLTSVLDNVVIMTNHDPLEGESFLSLIVGEFQNDCH